MLETTGKRYRQACSSVSCTAAQGRYVSQSSTGKESWIYEENGAWTQWAK